jgi:selenocysteine lyase/cysteine desulfurase
MPVLRAIFDGYNETEKMAQKDPEDYPIWGYASSNEFRDPVAAFVGCNRDEFALLRNATEANSYIANGLDMKPGDEVLMTDQEHPGGEHPWNLKAKRYGIVVKKVTLPKPVPNAAAVMNLFNDAITPRTRVLFFSHIPTVTVRCFRERTLRPCTLERDSVGRGWRARPGHDEAEPARTGLRYVFLQPAQMAAGAEGQRVFVCAR